MARERLTLVLPINPHRPAAEQPLLNIPFPLTEPMWEELWWRLKLLGRILATPEEETGPELFWEVR